MKNINRRNFIKTAGLAGIGALMLPNSLLASPFDLPIVNKKVRIGMIGVGMRGQSNLSILAQRDDVEIVAFADPEPKMMKGAQEILSKYKRNAAKEFGNGDYDYRNLL